MAAATRSGLRDEHDRARGEAGLHAALMGGPHVLARADRATLNRMNRLIDNALRDLST